MGFFLVTFKQYGFKHTALVRGEVKENAIRQAWLSVAQEKAEDFSKVEDNLSETQDSDLESFGFCEDARQYRSRVEFHEATEITQEQYKVLNELSDKLPLYA